MTKFQNISIQTTISCSANKLTSQPATLFNVVTYKLIKQIVTISFKPPNN